MKVLNYNDDNSMSVKLGWAVQALTVMNDALNTSPNLPKQLTPIYYGANAINVDLIKSWMRCL